MISGISPMLMGKTQKAGGVEVAGKSKSEKSTFAELVPGAKADPKTETRAGPKDLVDKKIESNKPERIVSEKLRGSPNERQPEIEKLPTNGAREKAISKFMDSLESEFGIPRQVMAEAMANLPPSLQNESPMETAPQVVEQLSLSNEDQEKALGMYVGLLMQLQTIEQRPAIQPVAEIPNYVSDAGNSAALGASALLLDKNKALNETMQMGVKTQGLQKYKDLNEDSGTALLGMGMLGAAGLEADAALPTELSTGISGMTTGLEMDSVSEMGAEKAVEAADPNTEKILAQLQKAQGKAGLVVDPSALKAMKASPELQQKVMEVLAQNTQSTSPKVSLDDVKSVLQNLPQGAALGAGAVAANAMMNNQEQASSFSQNFQDAQSQFQSSANPKEMMMKETTKGDFKESLSDTLSQLGNIGYTAPQGSSIKFQDVIAPATMAAVMPQGNDSAPVQQLMNQAQVLIRNGGGEMKIQMNPEGLGVVDLKVALQDGKLTINMAAEQKETKKLIESSLSELKSSLNAQHITVDNMKIDVVQSTRTDNNAQDSSLNQQHQEKGQQQRQFWQQFQENFGNKARRDDWMDWANNPRGSSQKRYDPIGSIEAASKSSASSAPRAMNSQRLNTVA